MVGKKSLNFIRFRFYFLFILFFFNIVFFSTVIILFFLFLLKLLVWGVDLFGLNASFFEEGLHPYSMLELGEKYHADSVYQLWIDELSKPLSKQKKSLDFGLDLEKGFLGDDIFPYVVHKTNPSAMGDYYSKVFEASMNNKPIPTYEGTSEYYLNQIQDMEYWKIHAKFMGLPDTPREDFDLQDLIDLYYEIYVRSQYLLNLDLKEFDKNPTVHYTSSDLKGESFDLDLFFKNIEFLKRSNNFLSHAGGAYRLYMNHVERGRYKWNLLNRRGTRYFYPDGPVRDRSGDYFRKSEYIDIFPTWKAMDSYRAYYRFEIPRNLHPRFYDVFYRSRFQRDMVHLSPYKDDLNDYLEKTRRRVIYYFLERAERKYLYQILSHVPDLYTYHEKKKYRLRKPAHKKYRNSDFGRYFLKKPKESFRLNDPDIYPEIEDYPEEPFEWPEFPWEKDWSWLKEKDWLWIFKADLRKEYNDLKKYYSKAVNRYLRKQARKAMKEKQEFFSFKPKEPRWAREERIEKKRWEKERFEQFKKELKYKLDWLSGKITREKHKRRLRLKRRTRRIARRFTWLRRAKRYEYAETLSLFRLKYKGYRYRGKNKEGKLNDLEHLGSKKDPLRIAMGRRRFEYHYKVYFDRKKIDLVRPLRPGSFPRIYINEYAPGRIVYRAKQFKLRLNASNFEKREIYRIYFKFLLLHAENFLRNPEFDRISFYQKWMKKHSSYTKAISKRKLSSHFPVMWSTYTTPYGNTLYFLKDYLPPTYWINTRILRRVWYKPRYLFRKSFIRDQLTAKYWKIYYESLNDLFRINRNSSPRQQHYQWFFNLYPSVNLIRPLKRTIKMGNKVKHYSFTDDVSYLSKSESFEPESESESFDFESESGESFEPKKSNRPWFTGFLVPAYKDINISWIFYYAIKGFWLESHFSTYITVLGSSFLYWLVLYGKILVFSHFFWFFWFLLLIFNLFSMVYIVRHKDIVSQFYENKSDMSEEEFVYWFFKSNYSEQDVDWSSFSKNWKSSNFYMIDKFFYTLYGKTLFNFSSKFEDELLDAYKVLVKFYFLLFIINFLLGLVFLFFIYTFFSVI